MERFKLGELIDVTRGASLAGDNYATEGELVRLTLGNFDYQSNGFKQNSSKDNIFYNGEVDSSYILEEGDIITPLTEQAIGLLGSTAKIPESGKYIQSQDVALVKVKSEKLVHDFAYYLLPTASVKKQLSAGAQQTSIRHTSPDKIKDCTVYIPDPTDQQKIADFLNLIDDKIAINKKENETLEAMAKQLYDYWFVQFDFPDANGRPYKTSGGKMVWNETLKREIPEGWSDGTLGDYVGRITNGLNPRKNFVLGKGDNYYITIKSLTGTDINWDDCDRCDDDALAKINSRSQLKINDVIFSAIGTIGRTYRIYETPNNWNISETSFTLRPGEDVPADFFYSLLRSDYIQLAADKAAMGSTLRCLVMDSLTSIPVVKVDKDVMKSYASRVNDFYLKIYQNNKNSRSLQDLRKFILPLLMNEQVNIR